MKQFVYTRKVHTLTHTSRLVRKVPEITAIFWIAKLFTTALGESTSDYLVTRINPYVAVALGGTAFAIALFIQFRAPRYKAWVYWFAVAMVAVFGTMAADAIHIQLGVPYIVSTIFFAVSLAVIFILWYTTEKTLSIHSINTRRREFFYWLTVMATFALGTAAGDLAAISLHLGYLSAGLVFTGLILVPAIAYWKFGAGEVLTFWLAYILTRPLGASFADWMGKSRAVGGLGWGDLPVSAALALLIAGLVIYMTLDKHEASLETAATEE